jgi:hypothetical protein
MTALMVTAAFGQENLKKDQTKTVSGTVSKIDFVGSSISIQTSDARQMSFVVPGNAIIIRDTQNIGLMDIKEGHSVTIQYNISSPGKDIVESIVDNKPSGNE